MTRRITVEDIIARYDGTTPFYASRRRHPDEPDTWQRPWTVRDRRTGAWYGTYASKADAETVADAWNAKEPS